MAANLFLSVLLLSISSFAHSLPSTSIPNAFAILSNSTYLSMALTLQLEYKNSILLSPNLTIFSPNDSSFASSGQPSLSLLLLHFSPISFSPSSLKSLPLGSKIPTLSANRSLIVTSSQFDHQVSLNGVKVNDSAIFDDGSLTIFGIETFLGPNYPEHGNQTTVLTVSVSSQMRSSPVNLRWLKIVAAFSFLLFAF